jgi:hypothetical protein
VRTEVPYRQIARAETGLCTDRVNALQVLPSAHDDDLAAHYSIQAVFLAAGVGLGADPNQFYPRYFAGGLRTTHWGTGQTKLRQVHLGRRYVLHEKNSCGFNGGFGVQWRATGAGRDWLWDPFAIPIPCLDPFTAL